MIEKTFQSLPSTPKAHFVLHFYAAVYSVAHHMYRLNLSGDDTADDLFEQYPFLATYLDEMLPFMPEDLTWNDGLAWWETVIEAWETGVDEWLPLRALDHLDLSFRHRLVLILAGLGEEDSRFGTLFAALQAPLPERRPGLELLGRILADDGWADDPDAWQICHPLLANGLLTVYDDDLPRSEWVLRVAPMVWDAARGELPSAPAPWCQCHPHDTLPSFDDLVYPKEFTLQLEQLPALAASRQIEGLILRGIHGSDRRAIIQAVARALGRHLVVVPAPQALAPDLLQPLGSFCTLAGAIPALIFEAPPGETVTVPPVTGYQGLVGFLMSEEGGLVGERVAQALTLRLPLLRARERRIVWQRAFGTAAVSELEAITERFHLPAGHIRQAARIAVTHAHLQERSTVSQADVQQATRTLNRQMLDTLATRLEGNGSWEHLVVSTDTQAHLDELQRRCRYRERLLDALTPSFRSRFNRGVRALLTGSSGTGKTMAARILSAELGIDLYRVDLAAVVNKYIGETEKNLHRLLTRAEALDVILLLDEGDALLGSRTEVKSANDRYANLETNYLLQKLEHYQGIILITTNLGEHIDKAFRRRMDVVIHFTSPQPEERWLIWQKHLPTDHGVEPTFLEDVAIRCQLTGGQIRNAVLHATLLAVDQNGGRLTSEHLAAGIRSEFRKAGAVSPLRQPQNGRHNGMVAFLDTLA